MKVSIARAVLTVVTILTCARAENASKAEQSTFVIRIHSTLECDSSGKLTFFDPPMPIFQKDGPKHRKIEARLGNDPLAKVEAAVTQFLQKPPPFWIGYPRASDQTTTITEVRKGNIVRVACVEGELADMPGVSTPPELFAFRQVLANAIALATVPPEDAASRDKLLEFLRRPGKGPPPTSPLGRQIAAIPNNDPAVLIPSFISNKDMRGKRRNCLYILAGLDGAPADRFYEVSHDKTAEWSDDERLQLLRMSLMAGSVKGLWEFPRVLHAQMSDRIEDFPAALESTIRQRIEDTSLPALASAVGESSLSYRNSMKAWDWMASHPDRLKFNPQSRQFQIVSGK